MPVRPTSATSAFPAAARQLGTGVILCLLVFGAAFLLAQLPGLKLAGTLGLSLFLAAAWRAAAGVPAEALPGIRFSARQLLRLGIVLLGARLDFRLLIEAGLPLLLTDLLAITVALVSISWLARALRLPERLGWLLAVGTAICGASAVAAAAPLLEADEGEASQAVGIISLLGAAAVIALTVLYAVLQPEPAFYGLLTGASLQEVGHVLAAAATGGSTATDAATLAKLTRVALLAPVLLLILWFRDRKGRAGQPSARRQLPRVPAFLAGFLLLGIAASTGLLPEVTISALETGSVVLTGTAMAAIGFGIDARALRRTGSRATVAAAAGFLLMAAVAAAALSVFTVTG